ncbi:unnamed protein product [Calypogeia fissa]
MDRAVLRLLRTSRAFRGASARSSSGRLVEPVALRFRPQNLRNFVAASRAVRRYAMRREFKDHPRSGTLGINTIIMAILPVSNLCFGTMTFGEQNSYDEACSLLNLAVDSGINFFDAAEMYPVPQQAKTQGLSEVYLGKWMKQAQIPRDRLVVATKAAGPSGQMTWIRGGPVSLDAKNIEEAINGSLTRLGCDYIDLYQLHWPDRYVPMFGHIDYNPAASYFAVAIEEQLTALGRAVEAGKIRHVGVSNETAFGVMECCRHASTNPALPRIVTIQNAYSLLCRTFDSTLAECCHHEQVSLLAYSPLAMGLLSGKYMSADGGSKDARLNLYKGRYAEAECRYNFSKPNLMPAVSAYIEIARKYGISPVALAIGFVLQHPLLMSAVIGATKVVQLKEILQALEVKITDEIRSEIDAIHQRYPSPAP